MGYNIANWEMIRTRDELAEKLGLEGADDTHALMNNMVDVRACYKPSGKIPYVDSDMQIDFEDDPLGSGPSEYRW